MTPETFASTLKPLGPAFNRKLDDELVGIYFRELGGFTESKLKAAVDQHIANGKFFPKIAELKKRLGVEPDSGERPKSITFDPELHRHYTICERLFDSPDFEHEPTRYPVQPIVDAARRAYRDGIDNHGSDEKTERRYVSSAMWAWNIRAFEGERVA